MKECGLKEQNVGLIIKECQVSNMLYNTQYIVGATKTCCSILIKFLRLVGWQKAVLTTTDNFV